MFSKSGTRCKKQMFRQEKRSILEEKSPKISIYLRNSQLGPSDYYRVYQYTPYLSGTCIIRNGLSEKEFSRNLNMMPGIKKKLYQGVLFLKIYLRRVKALREDFINNTDIVIVQREIFPHALGPFAGRLFCRLCQKCMVIWDFDDYIFLNHEVSKRERKILEKWAKYIVVTSQYLEDKLSHWAKEKVKLLPTTDGFHRKYDLNKVRDSRIETYKRELRLVWVGTQSTLNYVEGVIPYLEKAAKQLKELYDKKLVLTLVCNVKLLKKTDYLQIENIQWSREKAEEVMIRSHVGIMPLQDTEYALGKGGFKLIQYISTGMPVLASDVGFNREIVKGEMGRLISTGHEEEWIGEVVRMGVDRENWIRAGKYAYTRYRERYSIEDNIQVWQELINPKPLCFKESPERFQTNADKEKKHQM